MKTVSKLAIVLFLFGFNQIYSQILIINNVKSGKNSAETEAHYRYSDEMTQKAKAALESKDLEKAKYYLDQWSQRSEGVNVNYYVLLAQYCEAMKNYNCARRNYKKAYKKYACYECKEAMDKLPKE